MGIENLLFAIDRFPINILIPTSWLNNQRRGANSRLSCWFLQLLTCIRLQYRVHPSRAIFFCVITWNCHKIFKPRYLNQFNGVLMV